MKVALVLVLLIGACKGGPTQPLQSEPIAQSTGIPALADGKPATEAAIDGPAGVALDRVGNLYLTSPNENRVYKVGSDGILHLIAGNGIPGYSGDGGPAIAARLHAPYGIVVDSKGNVYVGDQINRRIRRITSGGVMDSVAGDGSEGYSGDGGPRVTPR